MLEVVGRQRFIKHLAALELIKTLKVSRFGARFSLRLPENMLKSFILMYNLQVWFSMCESLNTVFGHARAIAT